MVQVISGKYIKGLIPRRKRDSHKGSYGKVLIIAGSEGMTGAAVLAAQGALRSGAGLVRISIDRELYPIVQSNVIEATCVSRDLTIEMLEEYDSIAIGPGLGTGSDGIDAVEKLVENYKGTAVIDADALNIVAESNIDLKKSKSDLIITPHPGEAGRLLGVKTSDINDDRQGSVEKLSELTGGTAVLKGSETLVCVSQNTNCDEKIYRNTTGNPGMATGGSGDVLSGIIAGLAGQGIDTGVVAQAGVYIHGKAGDIAAEKLGEYGITATDIAHHVAYAIKELQSK